MKRLKIDSDNSYFSFGKSIKAEMIIHGYKYNTDVILKVFLLYNGVAVTTMETSPSIKLEKDQDTEIHFELQLGRLAPAKYTMKLVLCRRNGMGGIEYLDVLMDSYMFEILEPENFHQNQKWSMNNNGFVVGEDIKIFS